MLMPPSTYIKAILYTDNVAMKVMSGVFLSKMAKKKLVSFLGTSDVWHHNLCTFVIWQLSALAFP